MIIRSIALIFYLVYIRSFARQPLQDSKIEQGFLVHLEGCTGTLIHADWIISAAHCFNTEILDYYARMEISKEGDDVYYFDQDIVIVYKNNGYRGLRSSYWTEPLKFNKNSHRKVQGKGWRSAKSIICHSLFKDEPSSWKGYDLCLMKLWPTYNAKPKGSILPACLPSKTENELNISDQYYTAGFGQREVPFCMTDMTGPEKFAKCGSPSWCSHTRRALACGVEFQYKGHVLKKCTMEPNPSTKDPICFKLLGVLHNNLRTTAHVFDGKEGGKFLTSCYPNIPGKGWCGIRESGVKEFSELESLAGWGFCSNATMFKNCNSPQYVNSYDDNAFEINRLSEEFCDEQLGKNLKVEQPWVKNQDFAPSLKKGNIFCSGRNYTYPFTSDSYFLQKPDGTFEADKPKETYFKELIESGGYQTHYIDGGPNCYGDSGGPVWKKNRSKNKEFPVLIGVFSFMLWGTCVSRQEPSYHGRVRSHLKWIYQYVPEDEVCQP